MKVLMNKNTNDVDDTSPTYKALEEGSSNQTKEELVQMAQRQQKFIQALQAALVRINNKTYGIDRITGELIPKERLRHRSTCNTKCCIQRSKQKTINV